MDLREWNTSNITTMEQMFEYCEKIPKVDISTWDTSKVTTMYGMFSSCHSVTEYKLPDNFGASSTNF
jgi:surface protein